MTRVTPHPQARPLGRIVAALPFVGPWLVGFLALVVYPFAATLYWSFCRYDLLSPPRPVGTANYERLADELLSGGRFGQAVWNTAYYALLSVPLSIALGVSLAVILSWKVRGQAVFRTLIFLPSVVPTVAAAVVWTWLLDPKNGLVNKALSIVGLPGGGWFTSVRESLNPADWSATLTAWQAGNQALLPFGSKDGLVLMSLWGVGNFMIIYLAALGNVPKQLYEAAEIDGAGPLRRFRHITLPMLSPVIFFNLVMGIIQAVQAFTQVYIVSEGQGGPAGSTLVLSLHLFRSAFRELDMGYASAMAWTLFVLVLAVTAVLFRTSRHWVHHQGAAR